MEVKRTTQRKAKQQLRALPLNSSMHRQNVRFCLKIPALTTRTIQAARTTIESSKASLAAHIGLPRRQQRPQQPEPTLYTSGFSKPLPPTLFATAFSRGRQSQINSRRPSALRLAARASKRSSSSLRRSLRPTLGWLLRQRAWAPEGWILRTGREQGAGTGTTGVSVGGE